MQTTEGPTWRIGSSLPYHVNFACWLRQRWEPGPSFPEEPWTRWLHALAEENPIHDAVIVRLVTDRSLNEAAAREWFPFVREFNAAKPGLSRRLQGALTEARLDELMRGSERSFTFWHTAYPGGLCLKAGPVWVLGQEFLDPEPLRGLVARLLAEGQA